MSFWIIKLIYFIYRSILLRLASPMVLLASIYVEIIKIDVHPVCGNKRWADSSSGLTEKIVIKVKKKKKNTLANVIPFNSKNKCYTSRWIENFTYLTRKNIIKELGSILKQAAIFFFYSHSCTVRCIYTLILVFM